MQDKNSEQGIVQDALTQLEQHTGIIGVWTNIDDKKGDGSLTLTINGDAFQATAEVKKELREHQLSQLAEKAREHYPFMVVAENIFPSVKENLRKKNIAYLDTAGNIYIHTDRIHLWIDGRKPAVLKRLANNRAFTKAGLRTVFTILLKPELINKPYRDLARQANVALGSISNVIEGLTETGFILQKNKREKILHNRERLLRRWIDGYRETLKPSLHIGSYRFWYKDNVNDWQHLPLPDHTHSLWGGEGAASELVGYLNPQELTLYTDNKTALLRAWTLIPDEEGELKMYEKFWYSANEKTDRYAPPLLVYADLIITEDPRCIETADMIYQKYLSHEFTGN